MPSYVTPQKGVAFVAFIGLVDQSNTKLLKANPTLATGDVKVSIDGGAFANLATLPTVTPAAGTGVQVSLSTSEMNGDNIVVTFIDAAGAEWCDLLMSIQTTARRIDDLSFPQTSGRGTLVAADGSVSPNWADVKSPTTALNLSGTTVKTATDVEADTQDIQSRLPAALVGGRIDASIGAVAAAAITAAAFAANALDAVWSTATRVLTAATNLTTALATPTNITAGTITTVSGNVNGSIGGNLVGSIGGDILGDVQGDVQGSVASVVDLNTAQAEPVAVPAANATVLQKLAWMAALLRNKVTVTATTQTLRNNTDSGDIGAATVSDDGTTFVRGKFL